MKSSWKLEEWFRIVDSSAYSSARTYDGVVSRNRLFIVVSAVFLEGKIVREVIDQKGTGMGMVS